LFAESLSLDLHLRFTDPAAPLFIDVEDEDCNTLFVISTSQVPGSNPHRHQAPFNGSSINKKRVLDEDPSSGLANPKTKKAMKVVQLAAADARADNITPRSSSHHPPRPTVPISPAPHLPLPFSQRQEDGPLFLPGSQVTVAELGIENMDVDDLVEMLEGDGQEVGFDFGSQQLDANESGGVCGGPELGDEPELMLTQAKDVEGEPISKVVHFRT
jgi:cell cycle checkpoint control protein RAD9A